MGIIIRQAGFSAIFSYIGIGLGFLNVAILMNHWLTPSQLGLRITLIDLSIVYTQFAHLGSSRSMVRFFPYFKANNNNDKGLLSIGVLSCFVGFVIIGILVWIFKMQIIGAYSDGDNILRTYLWLVFPLAFFLLYNELFDAYFQARSRTVFPSFLRNILTRILTTISIVLYYYEYINFESFLYSILFFYAFNVLLLIGYLFLKREITLNIDFLFFSRRFRKVYFNYGAFIILSGISSMMTSKIDSLMLGSMIGYSSVAIYTNAAFFSSLIFIPSGTIAKISLPILSDYWRRNKITEIKVLYQKTAINQFLIGGTIFILIWCGIESIFSLQKEEYAQGKNILLILGAARSLSMISGVNAQIISISKYFRYDTITIFCLGVFTVISNWVLIPRWGVFGASVATGLSIVLFDLIRILIVYKKVGIHPFTNKTLRLVFIFCITILLLLILPNIGNHFVNSILKGILAMIVITCGTLYFRISDELDVLYLKYKKKYWYK